ncbi:hypothetical protein JR316_0006564 [Psilocybe cubensis]|uniref:Uncharacterized protein n=1 Tax=Psilocybe cubensis TaxID=181762 RepID=A0ACB8H2G0_PSICU|nr:hypothetical protein JR316_0006564 [Psilocybe cubensis]KAH9482034.1 hypothetical protein JR316_0006564 [Psilocybe cubensis]
MNSNNYVQPHLPLINARIYFEVPSPVILARTAFYPRRPSDSPSEESSLPPSRDCSETPGEGDEPQSLAGVKRCIPSDAAIVESQVISRDQSVESNVPSMNLRSQAMAERSISSRDVSVDSSCASEEGDTSVAFEDQSPTVSRAPSAVPISSSRSSERLMRRRQLKNQTPPFQALSPEVIPKPAGEPSRRTNGYPLNKTLAKCGWSHSDILAFREQVKVVTKATIDVNKNYKSQDKDELKKICEEDQNQAKATKSDAKRILEAALENLEKDDK